MPVFSYGTSPAGPTRLEPRADDALQTASFGQCAVSQDDVVFADADGVLFVARSQLEKTLAKAHEIWLTERRQADAVRAGRSLREQLRFKDYLAKRAADPAYTLRQHLRTLGAAIEE